MAGWAGRLWEGVPCPSCSGMAFTCANVVIGCLLPLSCAALPHLLEEIPELAFRLRNHVVRLPDVGHPERLFPIGFLGVGSFEYAEHKVRLRHASILFGKFLI